MLSEIVAKGGGGGARDADSLSLSPSKMGLFIALLRRFSSLRLSCYTASPLWGSTGIPSSDGGRVTPTL